MYNSWLLHHVPRLKERDITVWLGSIHWVHWTHGQIKWKSMWFWWVFKIQKLLFRGNSGIHYEVLSGAENTRPKANGFCHLPLTSRSVDWITLHTKIICISSQISGIDFKCDVMIVHDLTRKYWYYVLVWSCVKVSLLLSRFAWFIYWYCSVVFHWHLVNRMP